MLVETKNAVVYGTGGDIGGAGARIFLGGRTLATPDELAEEIRSVEGVAGTARVDVFEERREEENSIA